MTLKDLRIDSGLKARKIANDLGVSRVQLYNLEKGKYKIDSNKIVKFCEVYHKSTEEIMSAIKEVNAANV